MSYLKTLALQIPDKIRSERLLTDADPIANAKATENDANMQLLAKIWFTYIEPHKEFSTCPICLTNILSSFKNLKPALMEIEVDYQKIQHL